MAMDQDMLQYLMAMGDLSPEEAQIARTEQRANALREMGQPQMPQQQGRIATRTGMSAWFPVLAGSIGGGMMQKRADEARIGTQKKRDAAFQQLLRGRQGQQFPQYPAGYGLNDTPEQ